MNTSSPTTLISKISATRRLLRALPLAGSIALLAGTASAMDVVRANNNTSALNTTGAWTLGVLPTAADVIVWDSTFTLPVVAASRPELGADLSVAGIRVGAVGGTRNLATSMIGFINAGSANTLTIGAGGIDMAGAFQAIRMDSRVTLGASQTWTIANANTAANPAGFNNGEDLSFQANALVPFNLGGNTVSVTGAGQITITSGYTLDNGTIDVGNNLFLVQGGGNRLTTMNANVTTNIATGATMRLQSNSGPMTANGAINLNGGTLNFFVNNATNAVTVNGNIAVNSPSSITVTSVAAGPAIHTGNITGSAALGINVVTADSVRLLQLAGNNSGYSGTVSLTGTATRILRLNTATAGSAAATWSVGAGMVLQTNGVAVDLGTLTGAGTVSNATGTGAISVGSGNFTGTIIDSGGPLGVTKVGAGTLVLTGANTYTGPTLVSGGTLSTTPAQTGGSNVTVADGANFTTKLQTAGTGIIVPSMTTGTTTGATLTFDTGALGNPTAPVLTAGTFTPTGTATTLTLLGTFTNTGGTPFPLISYGSMGGAGFTSLQLSLPFRVNGGLVNDTLNSLVAVNISGSSIPVWRGTVDAKWDVDSVGNGSTGTANWFAPGGPNTYVQGAPVGTDSVVFDDSVGTGPTTIDLTTTLTPLIVALNNDTKTYTFEGAGKISGGTSIAKSGPGTVILKNTVAYDHTGGTAVTGGTLQVGDGLTPGVGLLPTNAVTVDAPGTLSLNRPDDFSTSTVLTGTGTVAKDNANTVTFTAVATNSLNYALNAGAVAFSGTGTLSGVISGPGELRATAGTFQLAGSTANTNSGLTTVSGGLLQLNKIAGTNAVGGDIVIAGTGQLALLAGEQIPDTAKITLTGNSVDSIPTQAALETVGNVLVNSSVGGGGGGQLIMRNGFTVADTATVQSGILGVASAHTATVNAINIISGPGSTAIVRIAGNSAASTLNVGPGGITASGGEIQVKFNTNNMDATLNLSGDFVATGNVAITNAGYTGPNLNVINLLGGPRTFNIAASTTTTVAPNFGDGDLVKTGDGKLNLNGTLGSGAFNLTAAAGTTNLSKSQTIASLIIADGALVTLGAPTPSPAPAFGGEEIAAPDFGTESQVAAVPEPGSLALLCGSALALLARRRRGA